MLDEHCARRDIILPSEKSTMYSRCIVVEHRVDVVVMPLKEGSLAQIRITSLLFLFPKAEDAKRRCSVSGNSCLGADI